MTRTITVVGGTSGLGQFIAGDLNPDHVVLRLSRRTGFDVRTDAIVPGYDGLVFSLRVRDKGAVEQFSTEVWGPAAILERLPASCKNVVIISSVIARSISSDQPWEYHASKAALEQMVRYYATTLGPVRVNAVAPGLVARDPDGKYAGFNSFLASQLPLKRMTSEQDVAGAVRFLLTPDCPLTGQVLTVDAGASLLNMESLMRRVYDGKDHRAEVPVVSGIYQAAD